MIKTPKNCTIQCGCGVMGGWDSCCVAGWLLPFVFSLAIPIGVARVAGGSGCFVCTWKSHAH